VEGIDSQQLESFFVLGKKVERMRGWMESLPSFHQRVDFLAMTDAEDEDFFGVNPEHDTVIPDSAEKRGEKRTKVEPRKF
jgi:hypothetical protein